MAIRKQLSIFLANRPGALSRVSDALRDEGINIIGISVSDTIDHAVLRMVVDKPDKAIQICEERNILILEGEILEANLPNRPGSFAGFAAKLAEADININYAYGSFSENLDEAGHIIFVHCSDVSKAATLLEDHRND